MEPQGGSNTVRFFEVAEEISARPERVWSILTDTRKLVDGGLGLLKIDGTVGAGARLKLWAESAPKRAFPVRVIEFQPPVRMVWSGGMPLGLFRGERRFTLTRTPRGTAFHMREEYSGLLLPLIWGSIPDLNPYFAKFARGLKTMAES